MSKSFDDLRAARATLDRVLSKRHHTTEAELDECVTLVEELRSNCSLSLAKFSPLELNEWLTITRQALGELANRIKNRPKVRATP